MKKKLLAIILTLALAVALSLPAMAAEIKFTDVPDGQWYTPGIYACAQKGLVQGVGDNQFAPEKTMTRAEFIAVVVRYLYQDDIKNYQGATDQWWTMYYNIALKQGLIKRSEFTVSANDMGVAMNRQEMALVISRALGELGQTPDLVVGSNQIPDYSSIGSYYKDAVKETYTAGIITGTDLRGTFNPMGTLTRGQACTVLYRLTEPDNRSPQQGTWYNKQNTSTGEDGKITLTDYSQSYVDLIADRDHRFDQSATHKEWVEGQDHSEPKVGDVVIKADGTRVTLEATEIRGKKILGWSPTTGPQGVDPYTGTVFVNGTVKAGSSLAWWDYSPLVKDPTTGSVFSRREWQEIRDYAKPTTPGTQEGQKGGMNNWYEWDTFLEEWCWCGPKI